MADYNLCDLRRLDLFPFAKPQRCWDDPKAVRFVSWRWRRTFPPMVFLGDCGTCLYPLAQFSPMVWGTMAPGACPRLRSGLWLQLCGRPFVLFAPLHALHLFSVLIL